MPAGIVHQIGDRPPHRLGRSVSVRSAGTSQSIARARPPRAVRDIVEHRARFGRLPPARCPRRGRTRDSRRSCAPSPRHRRSFPPRPAAAPRSRGSIASARRSRVSGVRRSCDTPASISVRCARKRRMRSCMRLNAAAAWRTSVAPSGRIGGTSRPMPNASAAAASRWMPRTWLRMNKRGDAEQQQRRADQPADEQIHRAEYRRLRGTSTSSTPSAICSLISTECGSDGPVHGERRVEFLGQRRLQVVIHRTQDVMPLVRLQHRARLQLDLQAQTASRAICSTHSRSAGRLEVAHQRRSCRQISPATPPDRRRDTMSRWLP